MYGLKGTLHAVLAHEFLHYLNILKNIINLEVTSDNISNTLYENSFSDNEKTLDSTKVFKGDVIFRNCLIKNLQMGSMIQNWTKKLNHFGLRKNYLYRKS